MMNFMKPLIFPLTIGVTLLFISGCNRDIVLFDGTSLDNWERTDFAGKGEVLIDENGSLVLEMGAERDQVVVLMAPRGSYRRARRQ